MDDRCRTLAFSPEFQRLRYVRLCNINSLYLTGASEPKRFEHCIGTYHLADLWTRGRSLVPRDVDVVRASALLHDMLTGPFGHSFQYVMEDNPFQQRFEHANVASGVRGRFLQLARAGAQFAGRRFLVADTLGEIADDVFAAIMGDGRFGPIISGTLDLDNLDNVVRLAFHMGLCGEGDRRLPIELAPLLEPDRCGLAAPARAAPLFERWFQIRQLLYEYLLLDRGEFAAKAMLTLAVELAGENGMLGPDDWRHTDESLLDALQARSVGEHQIIGQIIKRLRIGDLFECIDVWRTPDTDRYDELSTSASKRVAEKTIEVELSRSGGPRVRVCLHYILDKRKTCRSITFRESETGNERKVGRDSSSLLVGAFVTNARATSLSSNEAARVSAAVRRGLEAAGLTIAGVAAEPLGEADQAEGLFA